MQAMKRLAPCLFLLTSLLAGCPKPSETPKPSAEPGTPAETRNPAGEEATADTPRAKAMAAAKALGTQLKAQLKMAIDKDGFPGGIKACKVAAPEIAASVSAKRSLKVGRTSFKLRNPKNAPPAWAKAQVEAKLAEPSFAEAEDGTLHALLPIKLEPLCVSCHGPAEGLPPEVKQALARDYPEDQATGFQPGDLRGYFWVEVPPGKP
jgi:hypothetical protein